ncbi:hypothetical protein FBU30_003105 [Linnemannia zychae]|nr:hypothetical protein FBU30_003105 [Linnemannia zychae]
MRITSKAILFSTSTLLALISSSVSAQGQIAALESADSYCFFLPPMVGGDIAANEDSAIAFCNKPNANAPGAKVFPDGFVVSVHWATGDGWVQITGQIEPSKYSLNPCDAGGQYDIRAPVGASCAGYSHFVNVVEPTDGLYAMRCCQNSADCVVSKSTYGVRVIFGEQWDWSGPHPDGLLPGAQNCVNGQPGNGTTSVPPIVPTVTTTSATVLPTTSAPLASTGTTVVQTSTTASPGSKPSSITGSSATANKAAIAVSAILASAMGFLMA